MPARPDIKESRFQQNAVAWALSGRVIPLGLISGSLSVPMKKTRFAAPMCTCWRPGRFRFDLYLFPAPAWESDLSEFGNGATNSCAAEDKFSFSRLTRSTSLPSGLTTILGGNSLRTVFLKSGTSVNDSDDLPVLASLAEEAERVRLKLRTDVLQHCPATSGLCNRKAQRMSNCCARLH